VHLADIRPALRAYLLADAMVPTGVGGSRVHPTILPLFIREVGVALSRFESAQSPADVSSFPGSLQRPDLMEYLEGERLECLRQDLVVDTLLLQPVASLVNDLVKALIDAAVTKPGREPSYDNKSERATAALKKVGHKIALGQVSKYREMLERYRPELFPLPPPPTPPAASDTPDASRENVVTGAGRSRVIATSPWSMAPCRPGCTTF
jgi:hypothetical protein